ncbi:MAG TPA: DUF1549 domain-containing protein, partial [Gemmataceae bacterium]
PTPLDLVSQAEGIDRGKVLSCICALHGQALRVCQSEGPRPASFATAPGSGKVLFEFRRAGGAAGWKTSAQNEIDRLVGMKLRDLRTKSAYADWVRTWREVTDPDYDEWVRRALLAIKVQHEVDDATFLRRVYLDLLGAPPTAEELRRFLKETDRDKRAKLVERLLQRLARAKRLEQIVKETIAKGRELTAEEHRLIEAILKWLEEDDSDEPVLQRLDELRLKD